ncbi:MAG: hypothetical protein NC405_06590 [Odoribacter sp.]|nr:hypothetical protein [Odoribacter sp.]
MKQYALYGLSALMGIAFVACDSYEEPNPRPQTNPQGVVLQADQVSLTNALETETYSLAQLSEAGENITLATIAAPNLGDYYSYKAIVEMSKNGFTKFATVPATVEIANADSTLYNIVVTPDDLQGEYFAAISKGPKAKDVQMRYRLCTVSNGTGGSQTAYIGGEDNIYGPYTMNITPFPSDIVIEDNYYLVGTACDWEVTRAIKLNHSDESPYDDPVFTAKFDVFEGWWWKIIPESTFVTGDWSSAANGSFGVEFDGDDSMGGMLYGQEEGGDSFAGCLNTAGPYLLTINMEDLTYAFDLAIDQLYTPGNSNGWSQAASQMLVTTDYSTYFGFAHLNGEFKFTSALDWNGVNYGAADEEGKLTTDGGAGNINAPADALFWCTANTASLSYTLTQINSIGVIGDGTPGGWDADTQLTPSADFLTWTGTIAFTDGSFKFRCNGGWDINLGGDPTDLKTNIEVGDPANMNTPGAGTYEVVLHLDQIPYSCSFTKK